MPYHISKVRVEGIRGFNDPFEISLDRGVTLIYGPNGTGKSSLLQSIEWGLTGVMPYMKGGDFTREDAIVNMFHQTKKATVEMELDGADPKLVVIRSRKMSSSTTRGRQPLELHAEGQATKKDEEAEEELQERLGMTPESFPRAKYLHQDTLRETLASKPEERSQAIDKLLGTFEVREFVDALDIDRLVAAAAKRLEAAAESLKRDKIQFSLNLKRNLENNYKVLLEKGFKEEELTLASLVGRISSLRDIVNMVRETINLSPVTYAAPQPYVEDLASTHRKLLEDISTIDRNRMNSLQKSQTRKLTLQNLSEKYSEATRRLESLKTVDAEAIKARMTEIDAKIAELSNRSMALKQRLSAYPSRKASYEDLKRKSSDAEAALGTLLERSGDENSIKARIVTIDQDLKNMGLELEKLSGHQRIIKLAMDQLEKTQAEVCPVCSQSIDNEKLVANLRSKISVEIAANIKRLEGDEKQLRSSRGELERTIEEEHRLTRNIEELNKNLQTASQSLYTLIQQNVEAVDLESISKVWEEELLSLSNQESNLKSERRELEEAVKKRDDILKEVVNIQRQLQEETISGLQGPALLEKVNQTLQNIEEEVQRYSNTSQIDETRKELMHLSDILAYLRDEKTLKDSERELPVVSKQIEDLEARKTTLQLLQGSLTSIRKQATEYEKEASLTQIKKLEDQINEYYSAILGHPYFNKLKVDIEKEDPLIYSIKAASSTELTYIPTRFSTSQLNIAAIAIFMSNSALLGGELPLMILDDPTQNMDSTHKEALAQLVSRLSLQYQIVISTEDTETRQFIERHCSHLRTYEIMNWTPDGPEIKEPNQKT